MKTVLTIVLLIGSFALAESIFDSEDTPKIKNPMALNALDAYDKAVKSADETARMAKSDAYKKLRDELESAKKEVLQQAGPNSRSEASAIQAEIERPDRAKSLIDPDDLIGKNYSLFLGGSSPKVTYKKDGILTCSTWNGPGKWKITGENLLQQTEPNGKITHTVYFCAGGKYSIWVYSNGKVAYAVAK